jgi:ribulose kinase
MDPLWLWVSIAVQPLVKRLSGILMAATAVGSYANAREAAQEMTRILPQPIEPNATNHGFYDHLFEEVYRPLFPALHLYLDRLASIANSNQST